MEDGIRGQCTYSQLWCESGHDGCWPAETDCPSLKILKRQRRRKQEVESISAPLMCQKVLELVMNHLPGRLWLRTKQLEMFLVLRADHFLLNSRKQLNLYQPYVSHKVLFLLNKSHGIRSEHWATLILVPTCQVVSEAPQVLVSVSEHH